MPLVKHLRVVGAHSLAVVDKVQAVTSVGVYVCVSSGGGTVRGFMSPPDRGGVSDVRIRDSSGRVRCVTRRGYLAPDAMAGYCSSASMVQALWGSGPLVKAVRYIYDPGGCYQSIVQGLHT